MYSVILSLLIFFWINPCTSDVIKRRTDNNVESSIGKRRRSNSLCKRAGVQLMLQYMFSRTNKQLLDLVELLIS